MNSIWGNRTWIWFTCFWNRNCFSFLFPRAFGVFFSLFASWWFITSTKLPNFGTGSVWSLSLFSHICGVLIEILIFIFGIGVFARGLWLTLKVWRYFLLGFWVLDLGSYPFYLRSGYWVWVLYPYIFVICSTHLVVSNIFFHAININI